MRVLVLALAFTASQALQLSLAPPRRLLTTMSAESVSRRSILGSAAIVGTAFAGTAVADDDLASATSAPPAPPAPPAEGEPAAAPPAEAPAAAAPEPPPRVYVKVVGEETQVSKTKVRWHMR